MQNFDTDIDWIFCFCKQCWDFRKFTFSTPLDFDSKAPTYGQCASCHEQQLIQLHEVKAYYEHLNEDNN